MTRYNAALERLTKLREIEKRRDECELAECIQGEFPELTRGEALSLACAVIEKESRREGRVDVKTVKLLPRTKRLKQLIAAHGASWTVVDRGNPICFAGADGILIRSTEEESFEWHTRWVRLTDVQPELGEQLESKNTQEDAQDSPSHSERVAEHDVQGEVALDSRR